MIKTDNEKARVLTSIRIMFNLMAVVAGLLLFVVNEPVRLLAIDTVRVVFDLPPSSVSMPKDHVPKKSVPVPAPAPLPTPALPPAPAVEPSKRDWVDVTDKVVDWFTKIVGSIVALLGVRGLVRKSGTN